MKTPSTGNARADQQKATSPAPDHPSGRSQTTSSVKGEASPRLPHERDESSDSGKRPPDETMKTAHDDAESAKVATDRSVESDATYEKLRARREAGSSKTR